MHTLSRGYICDAITAMGFILGHDAHSRHADNVTDKAPGKGIYWHSFETCHASSRNHDGMIIRRENSYNTKCTISGERDTISAAITNEAPGSK